MKKRVQHEPANGEMIDMPLETSSSTGIMITTLKMGLVRRSAVVEVVEEAGAVDGAVRTRLTTSAMTGFTPVLKFPLQRMTRS